MYMTLELAFFSSPYANFVTTCGCISVLLRNDSVPWDGGTNADVFPQLLSEHSTCRHQVQVALASWQPRALRLPTARLLPPWWGPAQRPVQRGEGAHLPQRDAAAAGRASRPGSCARPVAQPASSLPSFTARVPLDGRSVQGVSAQGLLRAGQS